MSKLNMRINDPNDLETVSVEECEKYPGFYYYPDNKHIAANRCGEIINIKTGKILKPVKNKYGRMQIVFSVVQSHGRYKFYNLKVHRVLARIFIGRPSRHLDKYFSELEVNHIDGNPLNNSLENLEWCIGKENIEHLHVNGNHSKDKRILAKHVLTNEINVFHSTKQCADKFNIHRATFWKHLTSSANQKAHKDGYVFKFDDGTPWLNYPIEQLKEIGAYFPSIAVKDKTNNKTIIFETLLEAANYVCVHSSTLSKRITEKGKYENEQYLVRKLYPED